MRTSSFALTRNGADADADWPGILRAFLLAFAMTGAPILLHLASQAVALIVCVVAALVVARAFEQDVPIVIFVANVFQNVFAALISPQFTDYADIEILKSYSFVTTAVCYLVVAYGFLRSPSDFSPFIRRMIYASVAALAVVGVYFVLGLALNPRNATVYLRNIGLPILIFQTFLIVGARHRLPLPQIALVLLSLVMICSYFELFWVEGWLNLTNGWSYLTLFSAKRLLNVDEIKRDMEQGVVITSVLDYSRAALLNTTLTSDFGFEVQRLIGPNFNTISLAYFLAIFIAFLLAHGYWPVALLAAPLLIATSAKGPIALALGCALFFFFARRRSSNWPLTGLLIGLVVYAIFIFELGIPQRRFSRARTPWRRQRLLRLAIGTYARRRRQSVDPRFFHARLGQLPARGHGLRRGRERVWRALVSARRRDGGRDRLLRLDREDRLAALSRHRRAGLGLHSERDPHLPRQRPVSRGRLFRSAVPSFRDGSRRTVLGRDRPRAGAACAGDARDGSRKARSRAARDASHGANSARMTPSSMAPASSSSPKLVE